jgi:hypothetical protein
MAQTSTQPQPRSTPRSWEGQTLLNTRQAAEYLDGLYAPATLESMRTRGGGPPFRKLNGRVFHLPEDLDAWVAETRPVRSTAEYQAVRHEERGAPHDT